MELLQLRYFCHAAASQNFSQTAAVFQVPRSNISQCIRRLETELGVSLFSRSANRAVLTEAGEAFYQSVQEGLELIDGAARQLLNRAEHTTLSIGVHLNSMLVARAIDAFRQIYPDVTLLTRRFQPEDDLSDLDIIISDDSISSPLFIKERLFTDVFSLITARGAFPEGVSLTAEDLQDLSYITLAAPSLLYEATLRLGREMGFTPRIALQCQNSRNVPLHVRSGTGVAVVPSATWRPLCDDSISFYPLSGFTRVSCVYYRKTHTIPPHVRCFLSTLRKEYQQLKKEST